MCVINSLVSVLTTPEVVFELMEWKNPEDSTKAGLARINAACVLGQLLALGLVQDVFQPRLLQMIIQSLYQKEDYICKHTL